MSRDNPGGYKLEELLELIAQDLEEKNSILVENGSPICMEAKVNNDTIINNLRMSVRTQLATMEMFNVLGPDRGPSNPRV